MTFNISVIIGHDSRKHAFGPVNFIHQGGGAWPYLVPLPTASKQKGS